MSKPLSHSFSAAVSRRSVRNRKILFALALISGASLLAASSVTARPGAARAGSDFSPYVDSKGTISLPRDYKGKWTHLGSWAVAKQEGEPVSEIHVVFTQPGTVAAFNKTGDYPDGTVLVKEVRAATKPQTLTTGFAAAPAAIKVWFVMVRDRKNRFKDNAHWGGGWGWALFSGGAPGKQISKGFVASCKTCHVPASGTKWVYSFGYPDLKKSGK